MEKFKTLLRVRHYEMDALGGSIRVTNVDLEIAAKNRVLLRPHLLFMELHDHSNKAGLYFSGLGSHAKER
jgi:hypothetical protein